MNGKLIYVLVLSALAAGCGGDSAKGAGQQQYETVQEGSASGVATSIAGPGETLPPLTGTNADTTTAFALDPNAVSPGQAGATDWTTDPATATSPGSWTPPAATAPTTPASTPTPSTASRTTPAPTPARTAPEPTTTRRPPPPPRRAEPTPPREPEDVDDPAPPSATAPPPPPTTTTNPPTTTSTTTTSPDTAPEEPPGKISEEDDPQDR